MKKIWKYFKMASEVALSNKIDKRDFYIGCVAVRGDGAIVRARNESSIEPEPYAHAEARVSTRLDHGAIVYVVRVRKADGEFAMAKPCKSCTKFLRSKKVKRVYFTTGATSWDFIELS